MDASNVPGAASHLARPRSWAPPASPPQEQQQPWTPAAAAAAARSPSPPRTVPAWPAGGPTPRADVAANGVLPTPFAHPALPPVATTTAAAPSPSPSPPPRAQQPVPMPPPPAALAAVARASAELDRKARVFVDDAAFLAEIGTGRAAAPPGLDVRAAIIELGARFTRFESAFRAELATAATAMGVSLEEASCADAGLLSVPTLAPVKTKAESHRPASPGWLRGRRPGSGLWTRRRGETPTKAAPVTLVRQPSGAPVVREVVPGVVVRSDLPPPADDSPSAAGASTTPKEKLASVWRRLSKSGGAGAPGTPVSGPTVPTLAMPNKFAWADLVVGGGPVPGFGGGGGLAAHRPGGANKPAW